MKNSDTKIEKIARILSNTKEPPFRLRQIKHAIYQEKITDFAQMANLPQPLREKLKKELGDILSLTLMAQTTSNQAVKTLFETKDKFKIESVRLSFKTHESICFSSQSGCNMGCKFCSTGTMGFQKNLSCDEITDQVLFFRNRDNFHGSISFMGMGEPFMNMDAVFQALQVFTDKEAFGYSPRKINISTVGIIPGIEKLAAEFPQVNLAFSLHSPFNDQRSELMPINKTYPLSQVMIALDKYAQNTKRRVFLAYLLLKDINDSLDHAQALVSLIKSQGTISYLYHVNLINFNPGDKSIPFKQTSPQRFKEFAKFLTSQKVEYSIRQSFGIEINAACGQFCAPPS